MWTTAQVGLKMWATGQVARGKAPSVGAIQASKRLENAQCPAAVGWAPVFIFLACGQYNGCTALTRRYHGTSQQWDRVLGSRGKGYYGAYGTLCLELWHTYWSTAFLSFDSCRSSLGVYFSTDRTSPRNKGDKCALQKIYLFPTTSIVLALYQNQWNHIW